MSNQIQVPGVDFGEMARSVIAAKIAEALSVENTEAVHRLVMAALTTKVNAENGSEPRSYDRNTVSWVEYVASDMVRKATKEALAEQVETLRPVIKKAVAAELKRNANSIAKALVDCYANEAKSGYRMSVNMQFERHDR